MIFCLIFSIFLNHLHKCINNPSELGAIIKRSDRKLHMYVVYCQNKPVSEHIVAEHLSYFDEIRQKLKHKLLVSFSWNQFLHLEYKFNLIFLLYPQ